MRDRELRSDINPLNAYLRYTLFGCDMLFCILVEDELCKKARYALAGEIYIISHTNESEYISHLSRQ